jgi:LysM repeat protein
MMKQGMSRWLFRCLALALAGGLSLCTGCSKSVKTLDDKDWENSLLKQVRDREDRGEIEKAMSLLKDLLDEQPRQARAHLELAILIQSYGSDARDNALAIYHYRRYLDLRPETEKRELIENRIRMAEDVFAAAIIGKSGGRSFERSAPPPPARNVQLKKERDGSNGIPVASAVTTVLPETPGGRRTYVVREGDYLAKIANEVYGDQSKWTRIFEANKDVLGRTGKLRIGQVLVVPD